MEDSKSVLVGSPEGHKKPPVSIGRQAQPSEPIGDKNGIIRMALKWAVRAGLVNHPSSRQRGRVTWTKP
jgi:hypothetical protein